MIELTAPQPVKKTTRAADPERAKEPKPGVDATDDAFGKEFKNGGKTDVRAESEEDTPKRAVTADTPAKSDVEELSTAESASPLEEDPENVLAVEVTVETKTEEEPKRVKPSTENAFEERVAETKR